MSFPGFTLRGRTRWLVLGIAALVAAPSLEAAAQGRPPSTPRAEHERLTFLEGTWTRAELPAGESVREACAWLPEGRRHMLCRQRAESPRGVREQMAIFSYRTADSTYLLTVFLATGQVWRYEGGPEGNRWVFALVAERPGAPRIRQVMAPSGDRILFREEVSADGVVWALSDPSEAFTQVREREPRSDPGQG